jgi:hypothetical protein
VIRISHVELAAAQQDFAAWWRTKQAPATGGRRLGYAQAVKLAIYKYHSLQANGPASLAHFDQLVSARLTNAQRIAQARLQLQAYIDWVEDSGVIVADHRVRLNLPLDGEVALGGEVSRIDMIPTGYRAVLLMARAPARWKQELRMPLIQLAVANRYDRPATDVRVAVQLLDGNGLDEGAFPTGVRDDALRSAIATAQQVRRMLGRRRRTKK